MSESANTGESTQKRSKRMSLLRRKESKPEDDTQSDDTSQASTSVRGHSSKFSVSAASVGRNAPYQHPTPTSNPNMSTSKPPNNPLHERGASLESSVRKFRIVEALRKGDTGLISRTIKDAADGGPRASTSSFSSASTALDDTTILHLAIQCADLPVIEYVLSEGAGQVDINAKDKDGNTPLHLAVLQGRSPVARLLLDQDGINDSIANRQGRIPLDLARNPDIYQQLHLSRSIFAEKKILQVQTLITQRDYETLGQVLEEPRLKQVLDINSTEFVSDTATSESGGTLLHEAARHRDTKLIEALLHHGGDPFRRDRKGKLPQDVTKDDITRAVLKKSPAAVAAQRGIQEKAVLGHAASQGAATTTPGDPLAGKEAREMKGYLKKWTNYRKGYQLRWFVLEDGVLSYYKHQDDAGSACRGAINMRIAKLYMSAQDEKTKFEIQGKSSVKYSLKANHEVEAKRWFWALNNSIQWSKDQAKADDRRREKNAELLQQAKADAARSAEPSINESPSDGASISDSRRASNLQKSIPNNNRVSFAPTTSGGGSVDGDDEFVDAKGSRPLGSALHGDDEEEDDFGDDSQSSPEDPTATKDAFNITAQSARLQLDTISQVNMALTSEAERSPNLPLSDPKISKALNTYDAAVQSLTGLIGDLLRISKDRDAFWQYRLDRETEMRRMWEDSMATVAKEQEELEARVGESELKRKLTKRALREVLAEGGRPESAMLPEAAVGEPALAGAEKAPEFGDEKAEHAAPEAHVPLALAPKSPTMSIARRQTALQQVDLAESESESDEEFFDAVDAGEVEVSEMVPAAAEVPAVVVEKEVSVGGRDISTAYKGYENGLRTKLKMDADNRPQISLWGILKSMIGKDMTKMTLPVSFNEPTSLLYRCGEDMEYADLLDMAVSRPDSIERLVYVATFAASEYASTIDRVAKPFNPLLGETFEYVRPDKGYRFFIEQVSHHPPIGAAFAESANWSYWGESHVKSKFYGKSFDINPLGTWFLRLQPLNGGKEDLYTWKKVTSSVIGIITGTPQVDNYGMMEIKNWTTGEVAYVDFKPRGWKASSYYLVGGKVVDADGRTRISLGGRWNSKIYARITPGYEKTPDEPRENEIHTGGAITDPSRAYLIWKANHRPKGVPFNLTSFVMTFNHIDDNLKAVIAPTDSRLRPDQRAMEEGEYDFAASEKNRLEEAQRARRRDREAKGEDFLPAWFSKTRCEITGEEFWLFNGKYWERREKAGNGDKNAWKGLEPIYD